MEEKSAEPKFVRDLMSVGVPTCAPTDALLPMTQMLLKNNLECFVVIDSEEGGHAVGVVTRDDLLRAYAEGEYETRTAVDIMTAQIPQIPPDIPLSTAAQMMLDMGVRAAWVMHNAAGVTYPAAMLTFRHCLRHLAMEDAADIRDLGIKAARQSPRDLFIQRRDAARRRHQMQMGKKKE